MFLFTENLVVPSAVKTGIHNLNGHFLLPLSSLPLLSPSPSPPYTSLRVLSWEDRMGSSKVLPYISVTQKRMAPSLLCWREVMSAQASFGGLVPPSVLSSPRMSLRLEHDP